MENKENNNVKALNELSKGASMGIDAVKYILEYVEDDGLKNFLDHNYKKYQTLNESVERVYSKYKKDEPQETSAMNKVMTWSTLKMKTMTDSTTSKLAEILFQGFNMGIAEGRKLLNHKDVDEEVKDLIEEYVALQEESAAKIKEFL